MEEITKLIKFANKSGQLLSLLYDIDLLPEQVKPNTKEWRNMLFIIRHWRKEFHKEEK